MLRMLTHCQEIRWRESLRDSPPGLVLGQALLSSLGLEAIVGAAGSVDVEVVGLQLREGVQDLGNGRVDLTRRCASSWARSSSGHSYHHWLTSRRRARSALNSQQVVDGKALRSGGAVA
jgi:hypothetical protein